MSASVFCGVSLDGFLARPDGRLDFLDSAGHDPADTSFDEFLQTVDVLVMGRGTWDVFQGFGQWPYGDRRIVVLTHRPLALAPMFEGKVETMQGTPKQVMDRLAARGLTRLYLDGGQVIQQFLRAGLVDRLVVTTVPVLIGQGLPLFGALDKDVRLKLVGVRAMSTGLVQSTYDVAR